MAKVKVNIEVDRGADLVAALQDIARAWDEYEASGDSEAAAFRLFSTLDRVRKWMASNGIA